MLWKNILLFDWTRVLQVIESVSNDKNNNVQVF